MPKSSKLQRIKEVSFKTFQDQKRTNRDVRKLFQSKEEQTKMFQNFPEAKRNKQRRSKNFQSKEEQKVFQSFLGPKKSKWVCDKNLQIKGKQNRVNRDKATKNLEKRRLIFFNKGKIEGIL